MLGINPYITFNGNCEEAVNFYAECLGGTIQGFHRAGDSPMATPDMDPNKIFHTTLVIGNSSIMASDSFGPQEPNVGNNISLAIGSDDLDAADEMFNKMAEGGTVIMPMAETYWAARFGMLTDKYGINWMFNCEKPRG
jgi:PhnB protein